MSSNEVVRISSEWLDANKSRAYPFDEKCADSPNSIPSPVFTDAFFRTAGLGNASLYISRVVQGQTSFQVYAATTDKDIGLIADIPYTTPERSQIPVDVALEDGSTISGIFVVGDVSEIKRMQSDTILGVGDGLLFYGCVREFLDEGVRGIRVGDTTYTGVVDLVAGDGIELSVTSNEDVTTIKIAAKNRTVPPANLIIVDDATLLKELKDMYGSPVYRINGLAPSDSGDITIAYPTEGDAGYAPFPNEGGAIILKDASNASDSCENELIDTIMANIAELNARSARCVETLDAIDTANNVMSISLSRLT
jgi:hypothetical protein